MQIQNGGNTITASITGLTTGNTNPCKIVAVDKAGNESEPYEINVPTKLYTWNKYNVDEIAKLSWTKVTQGFQYILAINTNTEYQCYTSIENAALRCTSISKNLATENGTDLYAFVKPDAENNYDDAKGQSYQMWVDGVSRHYLAMEPWNFTDYSFLSEFRLVKLGTNVWINKYVTSDVGWHSETGLYNIAEYYKRNTFRNRKSKRHFSRNTAGI